MNLSFLINLKETDPTQWQEAFAVLKQIVAAFPVPLVRLAETEKLGIQRREWQHKIVQGSKGDQHLQLIGDSYTGEYGSVYSVYENLVTQMEKKEDVDYSKRVFHLNPAQEYFHCLTGYFGFDLFRHYDTCGHPYTYAVLAMGIYLEHCFYETSYLAGDYNTQQINLVTEWLESLLGHSIRLPKTVEQEKLWKKLAPEFDDIQHAITRFWFLSCRSKQDKIAFLLSQNQQAIEAYLTKELSHYSSVQQWGAKDLLTAYLLACNDLELFIQFFRRVQQVHNATKFSLAELLQLLIGEGICDKPFEHDMLQEFNKERPGLETGMESLNRLFFKMGGVPNTIDFYSDADELLELFAYYEPENGKQFKQLIDTEIERIAAKRKSANKKLEDRVESALEEAATEMETHEANPVFDRSGLAHEDYFIQSAIAAKHHYHNFEDLARHIGHSTYKSLKNYEQKYGAGLFSKPTIDAYLQEIYSEIWTRGFALTEHTWQAMDQQQDEQILQGLLYMASLTEREMKFWNMRKDFFESPDYWVFLKGSTELDI